jgi:hypothetical protein
MTRLTIDLSTYRHSCTKHEHYQTGLLNEVVENSASRHAAWVQTRIVGLDNLSLFIDDLSRAHLDRHIADAVNAVCGLRRLCPNKAHGSIACEDRGHVRLLP